MKLLASAIRNQENLISGEKERPVELSRDLITLSKNIDLSDLLNHGMKSNFVGNSIKKRKSFFFAIAFRDLLFLLFVLQIAQTKLRKQL